MYLLEMLISIIIALVVMAFFTLLERKYLGYAQLRKGPNKVAWAGIPQPLADALKLFGKSPSLLYTSNSLPYYISPMLNLSLALMLWVMMPSTNSCMYLMYSIIAFLCISSFSVYTILGSGWSSNSKYALLGALRSVAQTISYEVSMALILIVMLMYLASLMLQDLMCSSLINFFTINMMISLMWFVTMLAETNRSPFDFAEGESELVSGFNTEYVGYLFAYIFMAEYMNIIFMSLLTGLVTIQSSLLPYMFMVMKGGVFAVAFLMIRASLPRMRYDRLMSLTWMCFLPVSLGGIFFYFSIS